MDDVLVILQQAITKEEDRHAFYTEAAQKACNPLARHTFEFLAADELRHKEYIQSFYELMRKEARWPSAEECEEACRLRAQDITKIFEDARGAVEGAVTCDADLSAAYEIAMKAERDSIAYYTEGLSAATTEEARVFYTVLIDAEKKHLQLLKDTEEYLNAPEQWFFDEEHWIVEG